MHRHMPKHLLLMIPFGARRRAFKNQHGVLFSALAKVKLVLTDCTQSKEQVEPKSLDEANIARPRH